MFNVINCFCYKTIPVFFIFFFINLIILNEKNQFYYIYYIYFILSVPYLLLLRRFWIIYEVGEKEIDYFFGRLIAGPFSR